MMSSWIRLGKLPCLMLVNPAQNIFVIQRAVGHTKAQRNQVSIRVSNLSGKLQRGSLRYREAVELADVLGYDVVWQKRR